MDPAGAPFFQWFASLPPDLQQRVIDIATKINAATSAGGEVDVDEAHNEINAINNDFNARGAAATGSGFLG
jgi:hypothetical protein